MRAIEAKVEQNPAPQASALYILSIVIDEPPESVVAKRGKSVEFGWQHQGLLCRYVPNAGFPHAICVYLPDPQTATEQNREAMRLLLPNRLLDKVAKNGWPLGDIDVKDARIILKRLRYTML